jgi:hypothetical protein
MRRRGRARWGRDDVAAFRGVPVDAILIPKVSHQVHVEAVAALIPDVPLWAMMETAIVAWHAAEIAAHPRIAGFVVGTNDLCNPYVSAGMHSTHSLVDRRYLDEVGGVVDAGPGSFLPTCFTHQFTDTEFIGTAKMRAVFAPCLDSVVEHLHWSLGLTPSDATTAKTIAHLDDDAALYDERKELWCNLSR